MGHVWIIKKTNYAFLKLHLITVVDDITSFAVFNCFRHAASVTANNWLATSVRFKKGYPKSFKIVIIRSSITNHDKDVASLIILNNLTISYIPFYHDVFREIAFRDVSLNFSTKAKIRA